MSSPICIAYGDGVGPEILEAALTVMREAGAALEITTVEIGQRIIAMGSDSGILPSGLERLRQARALLKGPTITPADFTSVGDILQTGLGLTDSAVAEFPFAEFPPLQVRCATGETFGLFEPLQEPLSAIAGKNIANPSAMLLAGVKLLEYLGQPQPAALIRNAWLRTMQDGLHTRDVFRKGVSQKRLRADAFTAAIVERLGQKPAGG